MLSVGGEEVLGGMAVEVAGGAPVEELGLGTPVVLFGRVVMFGAGVGDGVIDGGYLGVTTCSRVRS